jgi:hypothetical protein
MYTREELIVKIQNIDAAIEAALLGRQYRLDTGQGRQDITRQSLKDLREMREYWIIELEALSDTGLMRIDNCFYK